MNPARAREEADDGSGAAELRRPRQLPNARKERRSTTREAFLPRSRDFTSLLNKNVGNDEDQMGTISRARDTNRDEILALL